MNDKLTTRNLTSPTFHHATQTTWRILAFACISCVIASSLFPVQTIEEGFEGSTFPPDGWTVIQNNPNKTWKIATMDDRSHGGAHYADVESDQSAMDEIFISPYVEVGGEDKVEFWSKGSLNWGGGEPLDNYDAEIWLVIGEWGGDDVYVGKADDDWIGNFEWSYSSYDLSSLIPEGESEYRVAFRYVGNNGAQFGLDDVVIGKETVGTPTPTPTPTLSPTPTVSPTPTLSPTPTVSPTPTLSPTPTVSPTPTLSPTPTVSPTPTPSPTPTVTSTPSPTESFDINYWFLY